MLTRVLLALNYQVSPILAQAGQHGCVQNRPRFFLFAARRGSVLPKPPLPMHVFKPAQRRKLFIEGDFIGGAKRGRMANTDSDDEDGNNFAPHPGFTIKDATSDLPKFDWINPHEVIAQTPADKKTVQTRLASGIKQCDASTTPVGYAEPVPYLTEPQTRYQREMRRSNSSLVEDHVTLRYSSFVVEATVTVPLKPKAGHPDLPRAFHKRLNPNKTRKFGQLDENGPFKTAMTQVSPSSHGSQLLHPTQKRTITVLEAKRAQGFPDSFKLWSDASNAGGVIRQYYKHIGNAVPVPLAAAVSRSFEQALLQSESSRREDSPEAELPVSDD
ncbi:BAH domain-containing protein [Mycena indigotica]|uniref:DNA (cytosine-5-)-methyltransferase n=1 Tax=Mycena indigotica TaxID=2126181 RepID=A0A8H6S9U6_9AGAR|nr:BAH domain-containing protein [Mycena indigotica]KAF7295498.1 BAH domain-containing protein [Mycena indigotica]